MQYIHMCIYKRNRELTNIRAIEYPSNRNNTNSVSRTGCIRIARARQVFEWYSNLNWIPSIWIYLDRNCVDIRWLEEMIIRTRSERETFSIWNIVRNDWREKWNFLEKKKKKKINWPPFLVFWSTITRSVRTRVYLVISKSRSRAMRIVDRNCVRVG